MSPAEPEYIDLTPARIRAMEEWAARNPPESGVVAITREPQHAAFWRWVETRWRARVCE